jgi:hypothetical protein
MGFGCLIFSGQLKKKKKLAHEFKAPQNFAVVLKCVWPIALRDLGVIKKLRRHAADQEQTRKYTSQKWLNQRRGEQSR